MKENPTTTTSKGTHNKLRGVGVPVTFVVVMVPWLFAYVQIYQTVHMTYVQFFV